MNDIEHDGFKFEITSSGKPVCEGILLLKQLIACKLGDNKPHRALIRFAAQFSQAEAVQIVYNLRQEEFRNGIAITDAANWLAKLAA
ncbi:MAG: hypothetical protein ABL892_08100 [Thiobacillaceae bacterium]